MHIDKEIFELVFPKGMFEWFEVTRGASDAENAYITIEEKDLPPLSDQNKHNKIVARKFHDITIKDFPLRGKRTLLTVRRRYWQMEGQREYLWRDLKLCFPGTRLEQEFADFLKAGSGD